MKYNNNLKYTLQKKKDLSKLLIIFDIDGVLLRNYKGLVEYSPIINNLFSFIEKNNIKFAIATHGGNHVILQHQSSPIHSYMNNLDPTFIKHIAMPQYSFEQFKEQMITDIINETLDEHDITDVMFFDDDHNNINKFNELQQTFSKLRFTSIPINLNTEDKNKGLNYPLLRYESFSVKSTDLNIIFNNLLQ